MVRPRFLPIALCRHQSHMGSVTPQVTLLERWTFLWTDLAATSYHHHRPNTLMLPLSFSFREIIDSSALSFSLSLKSLAIIGINMLFRRSYSSSLEMALSKFSLNIFSPRLSDTCVIVW